MKQVNLQLLDDAYGTREGIDLRDRVARVLQSVVDNKKVLFVGYACPYLDILQNCNTFYAIPCGYDRRSVPLSKKTILLEAKKLPFSDEAFDIVISVHLLEFSRYSAEFLHEFTRILDEQGVLINISFNRYASRVKCRSTNNIIELIEKNHRLNIEKIMGLSRGFQIWPYDFKVNVSKYNAFLMNILPFLADMILIKSRKTSLAPAMNFEPDYGIANG